MSNENEQLLSAQVILKPAEGKGVSTDEQITSANVGGMLPSAEDSKKSQKYFSELGFEVSGQFANSFSITGSRKLFEKIFDVKLSRDSKQSIKVRAGGNDRESSELPPENLSAEIKKIVETITFSESPDFGPGNF